MKQKKVWALLVAALMVLGIPSLAFAEEGLPVEEAVEQTPIGITEQADSLVETQPEAIEAEAETAAIDATAIDFETDEVSGQYEEELPNLPFEYREITVGQTLQRDENGNLVFQFSPQTEGLYQLVLVPDKRVDMATLVTDSMDPLGMQIPYWEESGSEGNAYYCFPGYTYRFRATGYESVTLTNDQPPSLQIGKEFSGEKQGVKLFLFRAPEQARYAVKFTGYTTGESDVSIYKNKIAEQIHRGDSPTVMLKKGQVCVIRAYDVETISVKKTGYVNVASATEVALFYSKDAEQQYPNITDTWNCDTLAYDTSKAIFSGPTRNNTQTLAVMADVETTVILKNSKGKVVKWLGTRTVDFSQTVYTAKIKTNGKERKFTVTVIPESGELKKAKTYAIHLNPPVKSVGAIKKVGAKIVQRDVYLSWSVAKNANYYNIYRTHDGKAGYEKVGSTKSGRSFTDHGAASLKNAKYKIVPYAVLSNKTIRGKGIVVQVK